ncbi:MAG TPA: acyl-CoA thioesterase [Thermoanaerobaculia bacterium]|jgi:acyl-CoA thioester hydrolase|nr:acyl-CoA thioesterase [Thermoanaerobaculia bacterium]
MTLTIEVPYGDIDAMGHLNNVAYLRYLESARSKYWLAMRGTDDFWKIDFVVARSEIDYRSSAHMGEVLTVEVRVSRMGNSSFDFTYRVTGADGRLVADAKTTQVCYDWETRRSKPLSEERRREIERFEAASPGR